MATSQHTSRRDGRNEHTLVGARVLKQHDLALLEVQTCLLGEEQVRTLDDILEVRLALGVDKCCDVRHVDRLGASTARDEQVRLSTLR